MSAAHYEVSGNAHGCWVIAKGAQTPIVDGISEDAALAVCAALNALRAAATMNRDTVEAQATEIRILRERASHAERGLHAVMARADTYLDRAHVNAETRAAYEAASGLSAIAQNALIRGGVQS